MRNNYDRHCLFPLVGCCLIILLAGCGSLQTGAPPSGNGTVTTGQTPGNSPATSPVPLQLTTCPAAGTARAAVMPPLALGSHQNIVYIVNESSGNVPTFGTLKRFDITTGHKTEIVKLAHVAISEAQVSADGQWILFIGLYASREKLQLIRMDGQALQTLYCAPLPPGGANPASGLANVQWSSHQKLVVFDSFTDNGNPVYLLNMQSGSVQTEFSSGTGNGFTYSPRTWLDTTRVYLLGPAVDAPPGSLYILDTSRGPNQTLNDLQEVVDASAILFCWDFDSNFSGSQLFTSQCTTDPNPNGPGISDQRAPSSINVRPATGGAERTVFTSATLAVTAVRVISKTTMLLLVDNTNGDTQHNGLWKVNTDGTGLTQLAFDGAGVSAGPSQLCQYTQFPWSNASRDGRMYALQHTSGGVHPTVSLLVGSLRGGTPTEFAAISDGTQLSIVGWTTM